MGSIVLSRIIGFFREWILAHTVGASSLTDVYYASFTIPDSINHLMASGALSISFIPMLASYQAEGREEFGKKVFRSISTLMCTLLVIFIIVAEIWAEPLGELIAPGFNPEQKRVLAQLLRIILPAQLFFYWGALAISVQHSHGRFFLPAVAPIVYNLGIILFGLLLHQSHGVMGFSIGVLVGCFVSHGLLQWWGTHRLGYSLLPSFDFSPEIRAALRQYLWLSLPIMLGFSLVVTDEWISKYFASTLEPKALTWLSYARTEMRIPVAILGQAAGIASFPYLARLWAKGDFVGYGNTLLREILKLWALGPIATIILVGHALPITHFIYGGGRLTPLDLENTASALRMFGYGVFFWTVQMLLSRGFYACQKTWLPSLTGTVLSIGLFPIYGYLGRTLSFNGLALAGSIGIFLYALLLWIFLRFHLRKHCPELPIANFYKFIFTWGVFTIFLGLISHGILQLGIYRQTQMTALFDILAVLAVTGPLAFVAQRTVFKRFTNGALY